VDAARLRHEKSRPKEPFAARHELAIATPEIIAAHIPLAELTLVFAAAERAMGMLTPPQTSSERSDMELGERPPGARWSSVVPRPARQSYEEIPSLRLSRVG
jgi:hypothetical protein